MGGELYCRPGIPDITLLSARDDLDTMAVNGHGQDFAAGFTNGLFHAFAGARLNQKDDAAAATRSANFSRQRAVTASVVDDPVDGLGRNGGQVSLAEGPFLAHEAASFLPIALFHGHAPFLRHFRNTLQPIFHPPFAPSMCL